MLRVSHKTIRAAKANRQGYWIPHAAAKALAAIFCWEIRHALTPLFGHDFPDKCLKPEEIDPDNWTIDPAIVEFCAQQAKQFREEDRRATPRPLSCPMTPVTPSPRRLRPGQMKKNKIIDSGHTSPYGSPYLSDAASDHSYRSATSTPEPLMSYRKIFTPINTPREAPRSVPFQDRRLPSPREILAQSGVKYSTLHQEPITPVTPGLPSMRCFSPAISPKTVPSSMVRLPEHRDHLRSSRLNGLQGLGYDMEWLDNRIPEEQQRAAFTLLSLKFGTCDGHESKGLGIVLQPVDDKRAASA